MTNQSHFPPRPQENLNRDDLVNYLLQQKQRGYEVFQDQSGKDVYELALDDIHCIKFVITAQGQRVQVQGYTLNNIHQYYDVSRMFELQQAVDRLAQKLIGERWWQSPTTARLSKDTPVTNLATISNLIGSSSIEAIFDPYMENRSFATLIDILSFGDGSIANGVRVLSTNKTISGKVPRLSKSGFDAWVTQLNLKGEIRIMEPSEHRRFMLLSNGQSLLLGPSLGSIHKNEAIRLESDTQDRTFFEQVWVQAVPLT